MEAATPEMTARLLDAEVRRAEALAQLAELELRERRRALQRAAREQEAGEVAVAVRLSEDAGAADALRGCMLRYCEDAVPVTRDGVAWRLGRLRANCTRRGLMEALNPLLLRLGLGALDDDVVLGLAEQEHATWRAGNNLL
jgi:hypothetical protein